MCRYVAYLGHEKLLLRDLLVKPENSLIKQSRAARETVSGLNADGFGIAWYDFDIDSIPGTFKSIQPAWNNENLHHFCEKIRSSCFLGHVRASTVGDVNQNNCHPFVYGQYAFAHNGTIRHFEAIKRKLFNILPDSLFGALRGSTDSECLFLLIMHFLEQSNYALVPSVTKAIQWVIEQQASEDDTHFSRLNLVITNGQELMATRYVSKAQAPLSLYFNQSKAEEERAVIVSSEPLNDDTLTWHELAHNSYFYYQHATCDLELGLLDFMLT